MISFPSCLAAKAVDKHSDLKFALAATVTCMSSGVLGGVRLVQGSVWEFLLEIALVFYIEVVPQVSVCI